MGVLSIIVTLWLWITEQVPFLTSMRHATFSIISVMPSTGYTPEDYTLWGSSPLLLFFMLSLIGSCTGSISSGIKVFRFQVLFSVALSQLRQLLCPHGIYLPTHQTQKITENISTSVFTFITLYVFCLITIASGLSIFGLDLTTSLSGAASVLGNVGPGLGSAISTCGAYANLGGGNGSKISADVWDNSRALGAPHHSNSLHPLFLESLKYRRYCVYLLIRAYPPKPKIKV